MSDSNGSPSLSNTCSSGTEHDSNSSAVSAGRPSPPTPPGGLSNTENQLMLQDALLQRVMESNRRKRDELEDLSTRLENSNENQETLQWVAKEAVDISKRVIEQNSTLQERLARAKARSRSRSGERRKSDSHRDLGARSISRERDHDRSAPGRSRGFDSRRHYDRSPPPAGGQRDTDVRQLPRPDRQYVIPYIPRMSPQRDTPTGAELSQEERDARTVVVTGLPQSIASRDLEIFFSFVGDVRNVRIITDNKTGGSEGIAYIEYEDITSVLLALGLNGRRRLLGAPMMSQQMQFETIRRTSTLSASSASAPFQQNRALDVGSLNIDITEDTLRNIFAPFGQIDEIQLVRDPETNRPRGFGFITFHSAEGGHRAVEQLNGFELHGRPMDVGYMIEQPRASGQSQLNSDELDRSEVILWTTGLRGDTQGPQDTPLPSSEQQIPNISELKRGQIEQPMSTTAAPTVTQCCPICLIHPRKQAIIGIKKSRTM